MPRCLFVSDLHGSTERYQKLIATIASEKPEFVFIGGDLTPNAFGAADYAGSNGDFIGGYLVAEFRKLKADLGDVYPQLFIIMGNDDARTEETAIEQGEKASLWQYAHNRRFELGNHSLYGYQYVPPTPFQLKDWERYDVSRYLDPGDVSPEAGWRSVPVSKEEKRYSTIAKDLEKLTEDNDLSDAVMLFHSPPHNTKLDRCSNDGKMIDHVPLPLHVGSIAVRRLIEKRQPLLTLHGHIHESCSLSGSWRDSLGRTITLSAAHDGPELALVRFDLSDPDGATRELL